MRGKKGTRKSPRLSDIGSKRSLSPQDSNSEDSDYGPDKGENKKTCKSKASTKRSTKKSRAENDEALYFLTTKSVPKDAVNLDQDHGVNLWLIVREVEPNNHRDRLPAELLLKIIKYSIETSDNPLLQLVNCSQVSEYWRQLVVFNSDLWSRLDLTHLPQTKRNIETLKQLFRLNQNIPKSIRGLDLEGWNVNNLVFPLINSIFEHQKLEHLGLKAVTTANRTTFFEAISKTSETLKSIVVNNSKALLQTGQSWLMQYFTNYGNNLETLDLNVSLHSITPSLFKIICSSCVNLKVLDLSTGVYINQGSLGLDASLFANNLPNLEVLRCATTSFKRVINVNPLRGLTKLKELSIPTLVPDSDRDDALFATLAYGTESLEYLDIRGSVISTYALNDLPSSKITALHMDDMSSNIYRNYPLIIKKWAKNLECLSLLRINNGDLIDGSLKIIAEEQKNGSNLRAIDLSGSDVTLTGLRYILESCNQLEAINLISCRCLPRGFKGSYSSNVRSNRLSIATLKSKILKEIV